MSRVRASVGTSRPLDGVARTPLRIDVEKDGVGGGGDGGGNGGGGGGGGGDGGGGGGGEMGQKEARQCRGLNDGIRWMLESGRLSANSRAARLLHNHLAGKEQPPPPRKSIIRVKWSETVVCHMRVFGCAGAVAFVVLLTHSLPVIVVELCSPCTETSSVSDLEQHATGGSNTLGQCGAGK
ncbi:unnamed protein product [Hydatigera taeniaeformis]|uniref:Uncharacterized protein n=1 Tax=Hydatigena taeniaeformis TaxID=6205 RepID=A0A0R3WX82_HYDTA|nr:unnamed protein product [Hydatigera taeniaeformis]